MPNPRIRKLAAELKRGPKLRSGFSALKPSHGHPQRRRRRRIMPSRRFTAPWRTTPSRNGSFLATSTTLPNPTSPWKPRRKRPWPTASTASRVPGSSVGQHPQHIPQGRALRQLAESLKERQITPLIARFDGTLIDGYQRLDAADLADIAELDVILTDEELSPQQIAVIQFESAIHRDGLTGFANWRRCWVSSPPIPA